jgi:demethylmenaquinone methyltransferase/2-methoxy-6-polyprenyl-1,4-benzoquinol methylase
MDLVGMQRLFAEAAPTYDMANHVLTFGLDLVWRRRAARIASRNKPERCLDVCSGTGDMAIRLRRRLPDGSLVVATDLSPPMIERARNKKGAGGVRFVMADARALPFPDEALDVVTVSFAARNLNVSAESLQGSLAELHRVLRPGGRLVNLETSQPRTAMLRRLVRRYVRLIVEPLGGTISGSMPAYAYLASTIPRFFDTDELTKKIRQAGFARVVVRRMTLGVAAIHEAHKS